MSKPFSDNAPLSTALLRKYRDGTLSAQETRWLEDLRAQDPFVADALDGMSGASDGRAFAEGVAEVQSRLSHRVRPPRSTSGHLLRVAASLVLLLGVGYLMYHYVLSPPPRASEPEAIASSRSAPVKLVVPTAPSMAKPGHSPSALAFVPVEGAPTHSSPRAPGANPAKPASAPHTSSDDLAPVKSSAPSPLAGAAPVDDVTPEPARKQSGREKARIASRMAADAMPMMSGRVVDEDSQEPLPGVNVLVKGTTTGTVTDINGYFSLPLATEHPSVVASSVGYTSEEAPVNQLDSVLIALTPDTESLSEVVVLGHGTAKESASPAATTARPTGGMRAFKTYVREALRPPPCRENRTPGGESCLHGAVRRLTG